MYKLLRITFDPSVMGGKPCMRGLRVTVGTLVGLVASGHTVEAILKAYPYLEKEDITEALSYCRVADRRNRTSHGNWMKILIDMNLSPDLKNVFLREGWDAVHWSEIGNPKATDQILVDWARKNDRIVFTHDLDFGILPALTHENGPSVIQVRTRPEKY